jgi:hypothetical protein
LQICAQVLATSAVCREPAAASVSKLRADASMSRTDSAQPAMLVSPPPSSVKQCCSQISPFLRQSAAASTSAALAPVSW